MTQHTDRPTNPMHVPIEELRHGCGNLWLAIALLILAAPLLPGILSVNWLARAGE